MCKQNTGTMAGRQSWECNKGEFSPFYFPHICCGYASCQACPCCPFGHSWLSFPLSFPSAFILLSFLSSFFPFPLCILYFLQFFQFLTISFHSFQAISLCFLVLEVSVQISSNSEILFLRISVLSVRSHRLSTLSRVLTKLIIVV